MEKTFKQQLDEWCQRNNFIMNPGKPFKKRKGHRDFKQTTGSEGVITHEKFLELKASGGIPTGAHGDDKPVL